MPRAYIRRTMDSRTQGVVKTIDVGLHPTAMAFSRHGTRLYVAHANRSARRLTVPCY